MRNNRVIVWFRQDLRLHDNEALAEALKHGQEIIPVFVFDERTFMGTTDWFGFPKTGKFRAQFIIESVQDLRESLKALGSHLIVRIGKPEEVIFNIAQQAKTSWVFCNRERFRDEKIVQDALEKKLWSIGQEMRYSRGKMLYYTSDLPFPIHHTPDVFAHFKKEVERYIPVRPPLPAPSERFEPLTTRVEEGKMPTLADFGLDDIEVDERAALNFKGGETEGLKRLRYYLWETDLAKTYKETRNELIGGDFSTKFSPWLAQGCLSPKMIYEELKKYEAAKKKNKSTYWIFFELMWRDFFRLMGKKHEQKIFLKGGIKEEPVEGLKNDKHLLDLWINARTGIPFIDANMREIQQTGFMSNRGRQNVASFLIKDLFVNWQMGAEYFESILIDYDVTSNWGNWNYIAGVGNDPRENRYFNILTQAKKYDSKGDYVKLWLPELAAVSTERIHYAGVLTENEQTEFKVSLGQDYPKAMVSMKKWR